MRDARASIASRSGLLAWALRIALAVLAVSLWGSPARAEISWAPAPASSSSTPDDPAKITGSDDSVQRAILRSDAGVDHARAPRDPRDPRNPPASHGAGSSGGDSLLSQWPACTFVLSRVALVSRPATTLLPVLSAGRARARLMVFLN